MTLLVLPAEVTQSQAETCLALLRTAARASREGEIVIDAAPLERFDSSALAVLLECRRDCLADGKRFAVWCLTAREFTEGQGWAEVPVRR